MVTWNCQDSKLLDLVGIKIYGTSPLKRHLRMIETLNSFKRTLGKLTFQLF